MSPPKDKGKLSESREFDGSVPTLLLLNDARHVKIKAGLVALNSPQQQQQRSISLARLQS